MKDDLISRSALLEFAKNRYHQTVIPADIKDFPAVDAVEVVRCKDCKHCSQNTPDGLHWCEENEIGALMDDDFCSYGERRADDATD